MVEYFFLTRTVTPLSPPSKNRK